MMESKSVLSACFDATDHIWDDREGYILAILDLLGIKPDAEIEVVKEKIRG